MSAKTSTLLIRIDPSVKKDAEVILSDLGLTLSGAVTLFFKQTILKKGLPFEVSIPPEKHMKYRLLTEQELMETVSAGIEDCKEGRVKPAEEVFDELEKKYDL